MKDKNLIVIGVSFDNDNQLLGTFSEQAKESSYSKTFKNLFWSNFTQQADMYECSHEHSYQKWDTV